ncbi:UvrD-helicase domain-containing protein, partial [Vibrio parahaemolyticus]|uniref:UvrD-helicase domain-containing protein n=1 Tax=Vibrio parahaemolyticus TaxID=670 RepID=UPI00146CE9C9
MIKANEKQREAIEAKGSIVVRAGAGTGKTQMLAGRFVHEVIANKLSPLEIVAVTYTEKAAAELRARVRMLMLQHGSPQLAAEADAAMIGTIHSLAAHICREFGELIDLPTDFAIL